MLRGQGPPGLGSLSHGAALVPGTQHSACAGSLTDASSGAPALGRSSAAPNSPSTCPALSSPCPTSRACGGLCRPAPEAHSLVWHFTSDNFTLRLPFKKPICRQMISILLLSQLQDRVSSVQSFFPSLPTPPPTADALTELYIRVDEKRN